MKCFFFHIFLEGDILKFYEKWKWRKKAQILEAHVLGVLYESLCIEMK